MRFGLGNGWKDDSGTLDRCGQQHGGGDSAFTVGAERLSKHRGDERALEEATLLGLLGALIPHGTVATNDGASS